VIRLFFFLLIGYVLFMIVKGFTRKTDRVAGKPEVEEAHRDPVCGVFVAEEDAVVGRVEGEKIYFCSMECLEKYRTALECSETEKRGNGETFSQ
jgi:YHS domain-containing protein